MIITFKEYPNGGKIERYQQVNVNSNDYLKVYSCCEYFAQQGKHVIITPHFSDTSSPLYAIIYASLMDTPYWNKCPDFLVDGVWYEHEGYDTKKDLSDSKKKLSTFSNMLRRGIKQSCRLVVEDSGAGNFDARRVIYKRIHEDKKNIHEVYVKTVAGLVLLYKKEED